jgi:hypothetical protein
VLALSVWAGVWGALLALLLRARPALLAGFVLGAAVPAVWGWATRVLWQRLASQDRID